MTSGDGRYTFYFRTSNKRKLAYVFASRKEVMEVMGKVFSYNVYTIMNVECVR